MKFKKKNPEHLWYFYVRNDPANWIDPLGLKAGESYDTQHEAAKDALNDVYDVSVKQNREYGGMVYQNPDGTFGYTLPNPGTTAGVDPGGPRACPRGTTPEGYYHTHGGNDPNYMGEVFSGVPPGSTTGDLPYSNAAGIDGYVATPSGNILYYDQSSGRVTDVGSTESGYRRGK